MDTQAKGWLMVQVVMDEISKCFDIEQGKLFDYVVNSPIDKSIHDVLKFRDQMGDWTVETPLGGPGTILNAMVLYTLIRHYNIQNVLETGVAAGFFSSFLLLGATTNGGQVTSVELSDNLDEVGKLVPDKFRNKWECIVGTDSVRWLTKNRDKCQSYQLYCHDSLHTFSHMLKELYEFKRCTKDMFLVYIDDQDSDMFWNRCINGGLFKKPGYKVSYFSGQESVLKGHLGGFLKYEKVNDEK